MRTLLLVYVMVSSSFVLGQQTTSSAAQTAALRDVLTRVVAAAGGQEAMESIQDLTEAGEITFHWANPIVGPVVIRSVGRNRFRMDADLPIGPRVWVVKNGLGKRKEGSVEFPLAHENAINLENLTFPVAFLSAALAERDTKVSLVGIEDHDGRSVYRVRLDGVLGLVEKREQGALTTKEFLIDALTFDILSVADYPCIVRTPRPQNRSTAPPREVTYGDFRMVSGIRLPFLISTALQSERTLTIRLHEVNFNTNVADADFDVTIERHP